MIAALVAALLLAAPPLPFPAPRITPVTEKTKYDPGTVIAFDAAKGELRVQCAAGVVTFKVSDAQVFDKAGQPIGTAAKLVAGQRVGVWYVVDAGARVSEIAVQ
jgi:phage baseplate assembly protein gpV